MNDERADNRAGKAIKHHWISFFFFSSNFKLLDASQKKKKNHRRIMTPDMNTVGNIRTIRNKTVYTRGHFHLISIEKPKHLSIDFTRHSANSTKKEEAGCGTFLTVKHVLTECWSSYESERREAVSAYPASRRNPWTQTAYSHRLYF